MKSKRSQLKPSKEPPCNASNQAEALNVCVALRDQQQQPQRLVAHVVNGRALQDVHQLAQGPLTLGRVATANEPCPKRVMICYVVHSAHASLRHLAREFFLARWSI